ncbi:glycosyltransferase [Aliikangiella maris]|uniref:Glycosyltransferase n=2 Tax=Aliikangiella maris TaxID=3162458 RepID=A0ABV3MHZ2_9GAMM
MKVLHITLGLGNGGAEGALFRLVTFDKSNEHIIISIMGDGIYGQKLRESGHTIFSLAVRRGKVKFSCFYSIYKIVKEVRPDVVQTWLYHSDLLGGIIARLAGVKTVVWGIRHSNLDPKLNSKIIIYIAKISSLFSKIIPKRIISCSIKAAEVHKNIGYKASIFEVIPNGYDLNKIKHTRKGRYGYRSNWRIGEKEIVFGVVGRWDPLKDHKNFIRAVSDLKRQYKGSIKCILVGPNIDNSNVELVKLIRYYELEDDFLLLGPTKQISEVMSAFDLLVLPSLGEAFPNVVAEAMACGTPCIVTDVGDASFIVGSNGWVVPPADHIALSNAMSESIAKNADENEWQNLTQRCRERIEQNFSIESMVSRFSDVWFDAKESK